MPRLIDNPRTIVFDPGAKPVLEIDPGEEIQAQVMDWCFGEVNERPETWPRATQTPRGPLAGPVFMHGAEPGDALAIEILEIHPESPGHMVIRPGCGPVGDQVNDVEVLSIPLIDEYAHLPGGSRVPLHPMLGVIGTTPATGPIPSLWAGDHGGNLDTREACVGSVIYLPVFVAGGLLAFGDVHAAMGDGELSGSGVEAAATVRLRVGLIKRASLTRPRINIAGHMLSLATHENLGQAIHMAAEDMIAWLRHDTDLSARDALLLIGAAGSIRVSQCVNKPGPTVKLILERLLII